MFFRKRPTSPAPLPNFHTPPVFEAFEPRLLLSADALGVLFADGLAAHAPDHSAQDALTAAADPGTPVPADASAHDLADPGDPPAAVPAPLDLGAVSGLGAPDPDHQVEAHDGSPAANDVPAQAPLAPVMVLPAAESGAGPVHHEVLFVDPRTPDYQALLDGLDHTSGDRTIDVFLLDTARDGVDQISQALAGYTQIDALHIVSHGSQGGVLLGDTWLTERDLADYAKAVAGWHDHLAAGADLLLYGCDLAGSADGRALVDDLAHLTGADVAASVDPTGQAQLGGNWELEYQHGPIETLPAFSASALSHWQGLLDTSHPLWLSTAGQVTSGNGVPGLDATGWDTGDILQIGEPNLAMGLGTTDGTFSVAFHPAGVDAALANVKIDGMHYVTRAITLGSTHTASLQPGDLLLSIDGDKTLHSSDPGDFPDLDVKKEDVFVFRPESPGDYSAGNFFMLLQDPLGADIQGLTLIEKDTTLPDADGTVLHAGDFLFSRTGGAEDNDVWLFHTQDVEDANPLTTTTAASGVQKLLEGDDLGVNIGHKIDGLDFVEEAVTIGGVNLSAGTILVSIDNTELVGQNLLVMTKFDIFALEVAKTSLGGASGDVLAKDFFVGHVVVGNDVGLDSNPEEPDAFTLTVAPANTPPTVSDVAKTGTEDTALGFTAADFSTAFADADGDSLAGIRIDSLPTHGSLKLSGADVQVNDVIAASELSNLSFSPDADWYGTTGFDWHGDDGIAWSGAAATVHVTLAPVGDTPQAASITTNEDTQSGLIVLDRNAHDGAEVTHFRISAITGGTLTLADGTTPVTDGELITVAQGQAGLRFTPSLNSDATGSFAVESSQDGTTVAAQSGQAVATITVTPVNDPPTGAPTITGSVTENQTLTAATGSIDDADGLGTFSYQWLRDGVAITGATAGTYALGDADVGAHMGVTVSYTDGHGTTESLTSAQTGAVANVNDAPTGSVIIDNTTPAQGQTLTASNTLADADGLGAITYTWKADGSDVGTGATYTLTEAEVGKAITVLASYTDDHGTPEQVASAGTAPVTNVNDPPTGTGSLTTTSLDDNASATNLFAGLSVNDADAGESDLALRITLSDAGAGTISGGGFSYQGGGVYLASGLTVAQANAALHDAQFTPVNNTASSGSFATDLSVAVDDQESGFQPVLAPTTVTVTRVNDAPVLVNNVLTVEPGRSVVLTGNDLSATDADNPNAGLVFTASRLGGGHFELVGTPGTAVSSFTQAQVDAGQVRFVQDGSSTVPSYDITVSDGSLSAGPATVRINLVGDPDPALLDTSPADTAGAPTAPEPSDHPAQPAKESTAQADDAEPEPSPAKPADEAPQEPSAEADAAAIPPLDVPVNPAAPSTHSTTAFGLGPLSAKAFLQPASLAYWKEAFDPEGGTLSAQTVDALMESPQLTNALNHLRDDAAHELSVHHTVLGSSIAVATGLSAGYVLWLIRGGVLLSTALSSLPAWRFIDPLPVLAYTRRRPEEDSGEGDSLEEIVENTPRRADGEPAESPAGYGQTSSPPADTRPGETSKQP